jgi:hypothetical protein
MDVVLEWKVLNSIYDKLKSLPQPLRGQPFCALLAVLGTIQGVRGM